MSQEHDETRKGSANPLKLINLREYLPSYFYPRYGNAYGPEIVLQRERQSVISCLGLVWCS